MQARIFNHTLIRPYLLRCEAATRWFPASAHSVRKGQRGGAARVLANSKGRVATPHYYDRAGSSSRQPTHKNDLRGTVTHSPLVPSEGTKTPLPSLVPSKRWDSKPFSALATASKCASVFAVESLLSAGKVSLSQLVRQSNSSA
jgi:hypothetical protein